MTRLIKRYGNRKLYDTQTSRYVTLDAVAELVRHEEELRIIDNDSGEDLTAITFAQIIYEEAKRSDGVPQVPLLRWIIRQGGETVHEIMAQVDRGREAIDNVRELAEERMQVVRDVVSRMEERAAAALPAETPAAADGEKAGSRPLHFLNDLLEAPQRQLEQVQRRLDAQVRSSIERITHHPAFRQELQRVEDSLHHLERQLGQLRRLAQPGHTPEKRVEPKRAARRAGTDRKRRS